MDEPLYTMKFKIEDVHLLHHCVCKRIEDVEQNPSNHPFEKNHLVFVRNGLYRAILDHKFKHT